MNKDDIFGSTIVVDTGAHLEVGSVYVCLAKFFQAARASCVMIGKGQGENIRRKNGNHGHHSVAK